MTATQIIHWMQLAASASLACFGLGRAWMLSRRRVRVISWDRKWWAVQLLCYLTLFVVLFVYAYEIVAHGWPLPYHVIPKLLRREVMGGVGLKVAGAVAVWAGGLIYGLALWHLGSSWRMGVDMETPGPLVTTGIFAWTRNPIYLAFDLYMIGTFLVFGGLFFLLFALAGVAALHGGLLMEEHYLVKLYGAPYREYRARVKRYFGVKKVSN